MRRFLFPLVMVAAVLPAEARAQNFRYGWPVATTMSAVMLRPEAPIRCSLNAMSKEITSTIPLTRGDFSFTTNPFGSSYQLHDRMLMMVKTPASRQILLAVADALRGMGIEELMFDWQGHQLMFYGDETQATRARQLVNSFASTGFVVAYDITMFRVFPTEGAVDWTQFVQAVGVDSVIAEKRGMLGKELLTDSRINRRNVGDFLQERASVAAQSTGVFFSPNRYTSDFALGQCGLAGAPEEALAFTATAEVLDGIISSELKLRGGRGSIATFEALTRLDQNILLVGIPLAALDNRFDSGELVMLISPKLIRTVYKEGGPKKAPPSPWDGYSSMGRPHKAQPAEKPEPASMWDGYSSMGRPHPRPVVRSGAPMLYNAPRRDDTPPPPPVPLAPPMSRSAPAAAASKGLEPITLDAIK
ncbi:hypothetical protein FACS1894186_6130 [Alphaproteobacteria bacterium]|nr:hypothetical protein FACS1894186_6130 [Alphaproteobacteria bacterium]